MYIGVQGTVESLLGAIFEIYLRYQKSSFHKKIILDWRNGFVDGSGMKTNIRNIFSDDIISLLLDNYSEVSRL